MITYTLKRKTYSDEKSGTGKKVLAGVGAAAATAGLAFAGARRGMLGTGAMKSTNKLWAQAGNKIGNRSMIQSGGRGYGTAVAKEAGVNLNTMAGKRSVIQNQNQMFKENNITVPKAKTTKPVTTQVQTTTQSV